MLMHIKTLLDRFSLPLAIAFTAFILFVSLVSPSNFPKTDISFSDKIAHTVCYAILAFLWCYAIIKKPTNIKKIVVVLLVIVSYGIFIEVLQGTMTTYRSFDYNDMLANIIGVCIGFVTFKICQQWFVNLLDSQNSISDKK